MRIAAAAATAAIVLAASVALVGCQPEPSPGGAATPTPMPSATTSATPSATPEAPSPSPEPTEQPAASIVPGACEDAYSAAMLARLNGAIPPLNDPGITMVSTQNVDLLEMLDGATTLRCTWGSPSETGISTNITAVDTAQGADILATLESAGFACQVLAGGTICTMEERGITQDDLEYAFGESHFVGDGGWVTTNWLNTDITGYTEDIVASLWG